MNGKDHSHNRSDILETCLFNHFDLKTWVLRFQLVFISPVRMFFYMAHVWVNLNGFKPHTSSQYLSRFCLFLRSSSFLSPYR